MDIKELSERANRNEEIPQGLQLHDSLLFLSLRNVYAQFHDGRIDRETAQREKNQLIYQHDLWKRSADSALAAARRYQTITIVTEGVRSDLCRQLRDKAPPEQIVHTAAKLVELWEGRRSIAWEESHGQL